MRVALVAHRPVLGSVKDNLAHVLDVVRREDADLVAFPEMYLSGYGLRDGIPLAAAETAEAVRAIRDAARAKDMTVVVGGPREGRARGVVHNAAYIIGPGLEGAYDKVYLPTFSVFEEGHWFREGSTLPVFETPHGRVGLAICYDLFFPEVTKTLAMSGADIIVCISASPVTSKRYFEAVMPARAIETTAFLLYTNIAGFQDTIPFWGGAQAWGPKGDLKARLPDDEPGILRLEIDLAEVREARAKRPALRDTRPEILRALLEAGR
ncbi:MAG TPA: carbon-nitrogen hydrolase family protein [Candidatus Thermoplasmatota archaeon]|nr:carbon-nitrogen hydrolase family protein [Candidatus Thermoplasmatota archaeon]